VGVAFWALLEGVFFCRKTQGPGQLFETGYKAPNHSNSCPGPCVLLLRWEAVASCLGLFWG
jgi:hypothetical protein